tara:strand:- start:2208 stop:2657 length:450 start_codon:yes stop_codon:yes gene_type:complete
MIAEMMAINAAFGVIKEVVGNGMDLYDCGAQLSSFFDNKASLQKKVNSVPPDRRGNLEEFFALEKIKQQEEELRQLMQWTGRAGLWDDWLQFQADAAKARREAEAAEKSRIYERKQNIRKQVEWTLAAIVVAGAGYGMFLLVELLIKYA